MQTLVKAKYPSKQHAIKGFTALVYTYTFLQITLETNKMLSLYYIPP